MKSPSVSVIIPAFNEENSIKGVVCGLLTSDPNQLLHEVIVVDNNSTDMTAKNASDAGARVVAEAQQGYGSACIKGISELNPKTSIVVFIDADGSDYPEEWSKVVAPIISETHDFVVGSRITGKSQPGALLPQAAFGNRFACWIMKILYRSNFTDLGPFRAIRKESLDLIAMQDKDFGWTVEMQLKALRYNLRCTEVPVSYRARLAGKSKITGTLLGTVKASKKILTLLFKDILERCFSFHKGETAASTRKGDL